MLTGPHNKYPHVCRKMLASLVLVAMPLAALADDTPAENKPGLLGRAASVASAMLGRQPQEAAASVTEPVIDSAALSQGLRLEAFPALQTADDALRLLDVNQEPRVLSNNFDSFTGRPSFDLKTSYVWESQRFGQFVVSTSTSYVYNPTGTEAVLDAGSLLPRTDAPGLSLMPERQSSLTFSWQIGNHTATAVTSYSDAMNQLGQLSLDKLDVDQLNELVGQITTLDLRYGYNVRAGRQGNASFSLGVRNLLDRRPQASGLRPGASVQPSGSMAYGTIKYQF